MIYSQNKSYKLVLMRVISFSLLIFFLQNFDTIPSNVCSVIACSCVHTSLFPPLLSFVVSVCSAFRMEALLVLLHIFVVLKISFL